jgi:class 3 adenylate cyclase
MGGTISTSSTDKMVAFFGYPETYEDDAERAVRAGLELLAEISQLRSPANQPLRVRIGVATGSASVCQEQAVVGEPVALAAALRDLASPDSVLIAESTRRLLDCQVVCEDSAQHQLAGGSKEVNACQIIGMGNGQRLICSSVSLGS